MFIKDKIGQIFSLDLMLSLIIIIVFLGITANAMDSISSKIDQTSYVEFMGQIAIEKTETLINTPGNPDNWESLGNYKSLTPGLSKIDNNGNIKPRTLSMKKIRALKDNYPTLENKIFPVGFQSSIIIYPCNSSLDPIVISNKTPGITSDVFTTNRTVSIDYDLFTLLVAVNPNEAQGTNNNNSFDICTHNQTNIHSPPDFQKSTPGWVCRPFVLNKSELDSTDFYLVTDPETILDNNACWLVDTPGNNSDHHQSFTNGPLLINNQLNSLFASDNSTILWLHVYFSGKKEETYKVYLLGVPHQTPIKLINQYKSPQPYQFILRIWI